MKIKDKSFYESALEELEQTFFEKIDEADFENGDDFNGCLNDAAETIAEKYQEEYKLTDDEYQELEESLINDFDLDSAIDSVKEEIEYRKNPLRYNGMSEKDFL